MANIQVNHTKELPEVVTAYEGEYEHLMEKIKAVYAEPIYSLELLVQQEKKIGSLYARKREIEAGLLTSRI